MKESSPTPRRYAGLKLLGKTAAPPTDPGHAVLETFPNPHRDRDYTIHIDCPDFTSLCPVTGQPDFAKIEVEYVADARCIETKSLKFYLASYRNACSFNEEVVNRILDDLANASKPRMMRVTGRFAARGGLALTVTADYEPKRRRSRRSRR